MSSPRSPRRAAALVVAVLVIAVLAVAAVVVLGTAQPRLAGTNAAFPGEIAATVKAGQRLCQLALVPTDTGAIELQLASGDPASLSLQLIEGDRVLATAAAPTARGRSTRFELPRRLGRDVFGSVCLRHGGGAPIALRGSLEKPGLTVDGAIVPGAISLAYYRPGRERLIAMVPVVAQRIGRTWGRFGGPGRAVGAAIFFLAGLALAGWALAGFARGRAGRRLALACAAVAVLNALAWSALTPPMQIPDEPYHLSYVQDLAEKGRPPDNPNDRLSDELNLIRGGARLGDVNFNYFGRPPWTADADRALDAELAKHPSTVNPGASVNVKDYPPVYYASLAPAYGVTHALGGSTLDAMTLMRAQGALLAGVTILALLALLGELFPARPLLAGGVALVCAYQPVFTWISGAINPDALLIALGALTFWLFARAFNRGLTVALALALGLVFAVTVLTKVSGLGFAPGWAAGIALLLWRRAPTGRLRPALAAALAAGAPLAAYALVNTLVWNRPLLPGGVGAAASGPSGPKGDQASSFATYLWQYFLPRVGSMTDFFQVRWTPKDLWTPLWVGKFGWYDYQFPHAVNTAAFGLFAVIGVAAVVALVPRLRELALPAIVFALLAAGLTVAIARAGYPLRASGNFLFEQARYLMPLIALYALALALAGSLLPRRFTLAAVALLLAGSVLHLLGAWELTIQRYFL